MPHAITFTIAEAEYPAIRAAADTLYGGSVAELVRDALRHGGFRVQSRVAVPRPQGGSGARPRPLQVEYPEIPEQIYT